MHKCIFTIGMQRCPNGGGGVLKIIAVVLERPVIEMMLTHLETDPQPLLGVGALSEARFRRLGSADRYGHHAHQPGG